MKVNRAKMACGGCTQRALSFAVREVEARQWFAQLAQNRPKRLEVTPVDYDYDAVATWATEADTAIKAVFSRAASAVARWTAALAAFDQYNPRERAYNHPVLLVERVYATFDAAKKLLDDGRLSSLIDGVRAETLGELLEQAELLNGKGFSVAATVVAGGVLESHLKQLCVKHNLTWPGDGSISKYNDAIAQARNAGNEIYSATDGKSVTAWGGSRNDAAHDPSAFKGTTADTRLMIESIRQFIARTP